MRPSLLLLIVLTAACAWGEPLTRRRIDELALHAQPRLQAAGLEIEANARLVDQADRSPNPVLAWATELPAVTTVSRIQLTVSQQVETGDKREARVGVAQAGELEARVRREEARRQLLLGARQAFAELLWAEQRVILEQESVALAERQLGSARSQLKLGSVPQIEVLQLEADQTRRLSSQRLAEAERESRRATLAGILQLESAQVAVEGTLGLDEPLPPLPELEREAERCRPDLHLLQATQQRRQAEVSLEQARGVSDLTVQLGLAYDRTLIAAPNPNTPLNGVGDPVLSVLAGLSVPLPIHDDNSGNIDAAQLRVSAAAAERESLRLQVRAQVAAAYWQVIANQRSRATLAEQTLPLAARTMEVLEEAYRLRARPITELLGARQAFLEASRAHLEAARQEELALVQLEAAIGRDIRRRS